MNVQQAESFRTKRAGELFWASAKHVPSDKADWKPGEGTTSARDIVRHLTGANRFFNALIQDQTPPTPSDADSEPFEQLLERFQQSYEELASTIASVPDEQLQAERQMPWGQTWKVRALLMGSSFHLAYHWGQIGYLQKAWGDSTDYHLQL